MDDEIVIELVEKEIKNFEAKSMSWIIQGFPRTRVQALALQTLQVVPDRMINLTTSAEKSIAHLKQGICSRDSAMTDEAG